MSGFPGRPDPALARRLLPGDRSVRVLVVGDSMVDHYVTGRVDRISPEAPVPVVRVEDERRAPGGAANVAAGVAALGAGCRLVSAVGEDGEAEELRDLLARGGVEASGLVADPGRPTTLKSRVLARHQQMLRIDRESASPLPEATRRRLVERAAEAMEDADAVALVDYDKGVLSGGVGRELILRAERRGIPSVVDPKLRSFFDYTGAFLVKPNGRELAAARGEEDPPREEAGLREVLVRLEARHLLLTLGEEGMLLVSEDDEGMLRIPSEAREVYDVSGAGDTVTAVLSTALGGGADVLPAAGLANFAAGLEVSHLGAVAISRGEILGALEDGTGGRDDGSARPRRTSSGEEANS